MSMLDAIQLGLSILALLIAALTAWSQLRVNAGIMWHVEVVTDRLGRSVVLQNRGHSRARNVEVTLAPVSRRASLPPRQDVDRNGRVVISLGPRPLGSTDPTVVQVTWSRRLGKRGKWTAPI